LKGKKKLQLKGGKAKNTIKISAGRGCQKRELYVRIKERKTDAEPKMSISRFNNPKSKSSITRGRRGTGRGVLTVSQWSEICRPENAKKRHKNYNTVRVREQSIKNLSKGKVIDGTGSKK